MGNTDWGTTVNQVDIVYRRNTDPRRGLATAGIFGIKMLMAIPHLIIVSSLQSLAFAAGYVGYWVVAFTGQLPGSFQDFISWWLRWQTRTFGWYTGIKDDYPPFDVESPGYGIDLDVPRNDDPNHGWAVAGIFFIKFLAAIPHMIVLGILILIAVLIAWIGFIVTAFTGRLPDGIQDFVAGVLRWEARVMAWIYGLTDTYPPFELSATPTE